MSAAASDRFPLAWGAWENAWRLWYSSHAREFRDTPKGFRETNMLADTRLGTWQIGARLVELSCVIMPNFGNRSVSDNRYVGVTLGPIDAPDSARSAKLAGSFAELEAILWPAEEGAL